MKNKNLQEELKALEQQALEYPSVIKFVDKGNNL